ncbi:reverse transcriptase domain-containing protein [Tanacetum coccineum]
MHVMEYPILGDPYEEAARQLLKQHYVPPEYVPDPDGSLSIMYQWTPPLLPIPLPAPSTSRRADIPEADTPPRKRLLLTTPRPGCEIGESSAAAAARQPGPTIETRLRDTERRIMTALELVNRRVTYQVDVCTRESSEFCTRHHDAQKDRAAVRAEIEDLARSEAYCRALEARVTVLETEVRRHEWQRQAADDLAVQHIMRTQALEAGARVDTLEDTASRRYIANFNPEEDEEDPEEDPADYPANEGDNSDDESSDDDNDDDDVEKDEEDEEEEEHLALADPSAVPTDDPACITEFAAALPSSSPPPENVESLKDNIRETMTTVDQGMSVEEIERVIAERVANAIEAIAIYETKTNMARKSISQTEQQECKVAENANNKRKWEGNHNGQCTVKFGNCKKVDHMTQDCRNPAAARNQRTHACYECGSLRHFKSECPIVKFQKRVDKKISTLAERQTENKRKFENTSRNSQNQQQQQIKRQNTGRAYTAGSGDKKPYGGSRPLCSKCNYHHDGPCAPKCYKCNKYGHIARDYRGTGNANAVNNQRVTVARQKAICYEYGNQGHYKRDCLERKNQSHKNQIGGTRAHRLVHTLRGGETDQDPNNIKDKIKA